MVFSSGICIRIDKEINETEKRIQKQIPTYVVNWLSTKVPRQIAGERKIFSTNGARKIINRYLWLKNNSNFNPYICICAQLCLILCDPMDCSPPGSSAHGIFQAKTLECTAISFSRGSSQSRDWTHVYCISCSGRWILYHWATWEAFNSYTKYKNLH